MPILDNLVEDNRQPEAVEGLVYDPIASQQHFISQLVGHLKSAMACGVIVATVLTILRSLAIVFLAIKDGRACMQEECNPSFRPPVSILIAA